MTRDLSSPHGHPVRRHRERGGRRLDISQLNGRSRCRHDGRGLAFRRDGYHVAMLTGDNHATAAALAHHVGIDAVPRSVRITALEPLTPR